MKRIIILVCFFFVCSFTVFAQSEEDLSKANTMLNEQVEWTKSHVPMAVDSITTIVNATLHKKYLRYDYIVDDFITPLERLKYFMNYYRYKFDYFRLMKKDPAFCAVVENLLKTKRSLKLMYTSKYDSDKYFVVTYLPSELSSY